MAEFTYGPGSESVHVQVFAALAGGSRWDQVVWGPATPPPEVGIWSDLAWQDVDCQVTEAAWTWACQRDVGILSVAEAGSLDIQTFDPDRQLDPSNVTGPFFRQVHPGTRIRILAPNLPLLVEGMPEDLGPVWSGWVDEISYDVASQTGRLRCTDPIALMAQTAYRDMGLPDPLPNTLRARARRVLADTNLNDLIGMLTEAEIDDDDPPVAPFVLGTGDPPKVWSIIQNAAADALNLAWIDAEGRLRFSDWGAFGVAPISLGCGPAEEDPSKWVEYLTTIEFEQTAEGIRNRVVTHVGGVEAAPMEDRQSIFTYGVREYRVDRDVPDRVVWSQQILDDRADASLTINAFESRPADAAELSRLLDFLRAGPAQTRLRDDKHPPLIDLEVTVIGLGVRVSPDGWVFTLVTSLSRQAFDALEPPAPADGYINIISEADGLPGDPSGAITLPTTPIPGNLLALWHVVDTDFGPTPPGFIAHPSGPVNTGSTGTGKGQWFWRVVQPGDGPTVNGIRDADGKVGLARLLELENVVNVLYGPSASADTTSPFSLVIALGGGGRIMGGIVYDFDATESEDVLAPLTKNVEEWEDAYPIGPVGSVVYLDTNVPGSPVVGESVR